MRASAMREIGTEIVYPRGRWGMGANAARRWLSPVLVPLSWVYQSGQSAVRAARAAEDRSTPEGVRVISVGNLELGGNGKTPFALHMAERILAEGGRPVYVSRGYGGNAGRVGAPTVVAPDGYDGAFSFSERLRLVRREAPARAAEIGDEASMVAARLPGVPLVCGTDKNRAIEVAVAAFGATDVVLDDAFQSWGVPRDLDIVLVDAECPFGNGWCVPAGTLREAPEALARADVIGINDVADEQSLRAVAEAVNHRAGTRKPVFGLRRTIVAPDLPGRVGVVSSIGRPERFERMVAERLEVVVAARYPDHHRYQLRDVEALEALARSHGIEVWVTTEKDESKFEGIGAPAGLFRTAALHLERIGVDPLGS